MPLKNYRCAASIQVDIVVEAESLIEAKRIIDGAFENADAVIIVEGEIDDPIEELIAMPGRISRTEITSEQ